MMIVFMEAVVIMVLLRLGYNIIQGRQDLFGFSKTFGIAVMIVGFLVLPAIMKVWIIVIGLVYLYIKRTGKLQKNRYTYFFKE